MIENKRYSDEIIKAADEYIGHPKEIGEDLGAYMRRIAFMRGAEWMERKMTGKMQSK